MPIVKLIQPHPSAPGGPKQGICPRDIAYPQDADRRSQCAQIAQLVCNCLFHYQFCPTIVRLRMTGRLFRHSAVGRSINRRSRAKQNRPAAGHARQVNRGQRQRGVQRQIAIDHARQANDPMAMTRIGLGRSQNIPVQTGPGQQRSTSSGLPDRRWAGPVP